MEVFSARLKWLREKNGITQKEMSERLGVSQPYYGRFEKGTGQPNIESLVKLPGIFFETLDFICGVTSIDNTAYDLMYAYLHTRHNYEYSENRIKTTLELLESDEEVRLESKIRLLTRERERMQMYKVQTEERYTQLIAYLKTIPLVPDELLTTERWDTEYNEYVEEYQKNRQRRED